tara:strand:+ start:368 stop:1225 length:858 start_codon:yes stop_codon:yes gene_type:complete
MNYYFGKIFSRQLFLTLVLLTSAIKGFSQLPLLHIDQSYELFNYQSNENLEIFWSQKGHGKKKILCLFNDQGDIEDWIIKKYDKKEKDYLIEIEIHKEYIYNDSNKPIEIRTAQKLHIENIISHAYFVDSLTYSLNQVVIFHMDSKRHIFSKTQVDYFQKTEGSRIEVRTGICPDCSFSRQLYYFNENGDLIKYYSEAGSGNIAQNSTLHQMDSVSKKKVISKVSKDIRHSYGHHSPGTMNVSKQRRVYKFTEEGNIKKCTIKSKNSTGDRSKLVIRINPNIEKY